MQRFWNWKTRDEGDEMLLNGVIDSESWFGDEVTPKAFRDELAARKGKMVKVCINSPGGDVFAASEIYAMLKDHEGGVEVEIQSLAGSAASVVAMAGNPVSISPTGMVMVHNPWTVVSGNKDDLKEGIKVLEQVEQSIANAYHLKTGLSFEKIGQLMKNETWMDAKKALELGFVDKILHAGAQDFEPAGALWSAEAEKRAVYNYIRSTAGTTGRDPEGPGPDGPKPKANLELLEKELEIMVL